MITYNPFNWYWRVAGSTTQVWSSAALAYVPDTDATYEAWLQGGMSPTSIDSEASLKAVLAQYNIVVPAWGKSLFTPREVIETLFTPSEQQAIFTAAQTPQGWQIAKFIALVTAMPQVDITQPEFIADVEAVEAAGLLTSGRAAQILAGTLAPTG